MAQAFGFRDRQVAERLKQIAGVPAALDGPPKPGRARPVAVADRLYLYTLTTSWVAGTPWPTATVNIATVEDDEAVESGAELCDVLNCHTDQDAGDRGVCIRRGEKFYTIDTPCSAEAT